MEIVLGSSSASRAELLRNAGVPFRIDVPTIDERNLIQLMSLQGVSPEQISLTLAKKKAENVSLRSQNQAAIVIGADQILECEGLIYEKPKNMMNAMTQLKALRGKRHNLYASAALYCGGKQIHTVTDSAQVVIRNFSDPFIENYLKAAGERVLQSVGAYQLEGLGVRLFQSIEGDFFTILGLPLLPLLSFFRNRGLIDG